MIIMARHNYFLQRFQDPIAVNRANGLISPVPNSAVPAACLIDYSIGAALTLGVGVRTRDLPVENN